MSAQQLEPVQCSTQEALLELQTQFLDHAVTAAAPVEYSGNGLPIFTRIDATERRFYAGVNAEVVGVLQVFNAMRLRVSTLSAHMIKPDKTVPIQIDLGYRYKRGDRIEPMSLDEPNVLQVIMAPHEKSLRQKYRPKHWPDGGFSLEPADRQDGTRSLSQANIARLSHEMSKIAHAQLVEFGTRT